MSLYIHTYTFSAIGPGADVEMLKCEAYGQTLSRPLPHIYEKPTDLDDEDSIYEQLDDYERIKEIAGNIVYENAPGNSYEIVNENAIFDETFTDNLSTTDEYLDMDGEKEESKSVAEEYMNMEVGTKDSVTSSSNMEMTAL